MLFTRLCLKELGSSSPEVKVSEVFMVNPGRQVSAHNTWLELTVTEGRYRLIRRMLEQVGHPVLRLRRVRFANLELTARLRPGQWRNLNGEEVRKLKAVAKAALKRRARSQREDQSQEGGWEYEF